VYESVEVEPPVRITFPAATESSERKEESRWALCTIV
jgi:hypothetical protein